MLPGVLAGDPECLIRAVSICAPCTHARPGLACAPGLLADDAHAPLAMALPHSTERQLQDLPATKEHAAGQEPCQKGLITKFMLDDL